MDPITITTTIIAVGTFFKDVLELALDLKESVKKIGLNKNRLWELVDDIHDTLSQLQQFYESHDLSDESTAELKSSLERFQREIRAVLERCREVLPSSSSRHFGAVKAKVKAWHMRGDIEADIFRMRDRVVAYHTQFIAFASARVEHTAVRIEHSLLTHRAEHRSKIDRLEVLITNLFLDTQNTPAQSILSRVDSEFAADVTKQGIEAQYLRLQVHNLAMGIARAVPLILDRFREEKVAFLQTPFSPLFYATVPSDWLIITTLTMLRWLKVKDGQWPILRVQFMAMELHGAGLYSDALTLFDLLIQILRQLVVTDTFHFLPRLGLVLSSKAVTQLEMGANEEAQSTVENASATMQLMHEQYPDSDFRDLAVSIATNHAAILARKGQFSECLCISKRAFDEQRPLLAAMRIDPKTGLVQEGRDASFVTMAYHTQATLAMSLRSTGSPAEAYNIAKSALRLLFALPRDYIERGRVERVHQTNMETTFYSLAAIYQTTGGSLSFAEEVVLLYRDLVKQHPEWLSAHFIRITFAFSYLCHIQAQNIDLKFAEEQSHVFESIFLDTRSPTQHRHFDAFITHMKTREFGQEVIKDMIFTFVTFDRSRNSLPRSLQEETRGFICALILDNIPFGINVIRQVVLHLRDNLVEIGESAGSTELMFLLSTLTKVPAHAPVFLPILEELYDITHKYRNNSGPQGLARLFATGLLTLRTIEASKFTKARALVQETHDLAPDSLEVLFGAFSGFATTWRMMGQVDDALECTLDGISLAKKHVPTARGNTVGSCISQVTRSANLLRYLWFEEESAIVADEALRLYTASLSHERDDEESLITDLARVLVDLGRAKDALDLMEQVTALPPSTKNRDFEYACARSVRSKCLAALGKHEEALKVAEEGLEHYRQGMEFLTKHETEIQMLKVYRAHAYSGYSDRLLQAGRITEALTANAEAVRVYRLFPKSFAGSWLDLATFLEQRSGLLWDLESREEAIETCEEVIKIRRAIGAKFFKQRVLLPTSLERLAEYLRAMGRVADAEKAQEEAAFIRTRIEEKLDRPPESQQRIVSEIMNYFPAYRMKRKALHEKIQQPDDSVSTSIASSPPESSPDLAIAAITRELAASTSTFATETDTINSEVPHPSLTTTADGDITLISRNRSPSPVVGPSESRHVESNVMDEKSHPSHRAATRRHSMPLPTLDSGRGRMETIKQNLAFLANLILVLWALLKVLTYFSDRMWFLELLFQR